MYFSQGAPMKRQKRLSRARRLSRWSASAAYPNASMIGKGRPSPGFGVLGIPAKPIDSAPRVKYASAVADTFSRAKRSEVMARIRGKDTQPELAVRRALHRL